MKKVLVLSLCTFLVTTVLAQKKTGVKVLNGYMAQFEGNGSIITAMNFIPPNGTFKALRK